MRRRLAWIALGAFGVFLAAAAPPQALAQQAPPAPAGAFEPGRLGAELGELTPQSVKALGLTQEHAALVDLPVSGGPADRAGVRPGDVIVAFEGTPVGQLRDLVASIQRRGAGTTVSFRLQRSGKFVTVRTTLARAADIPPDANAEERRIEALEAILAIFRREAFPLDWGVTQYSLGKAYRQRIHGDDADSQEKAIVAFEQAIAVLTREALPQQWAISRIELGLAYSGRIRGDRADNLEKAIAAYEQAFTVRRERSPREHLATGGRGLGSALLRVQRWREGGRRARRHQGSIPAAVRGAPRRGRGRRCHWAGRAVVCGRGLCRGAAWRHRKGAGAGQRGPGAADGGRLEAGDARPAGGQARAPRRVACRNSRGKPRGRGDPGDGARTGRGEARRPAPGTGGMPMRRRRGGTGRRWRRRSPARTAPWWCRSSPPSAASS